MVIAALLMCFIVLIQNSKGGGLASGFSSSNAIMGVRKTTDFLEKATWTLAIAIIVLCVLATAFVSTGNTNRANSIQQRIEQSAPVQGQPEFPSAQPETQQQTPASTQETPPTN